MNSKDLCLLPLLPQLVESGITSWKIEGRHKSAYYVANTVRVYRAALDAYYEGKWSELLAKTWCKELGKVSHRDYTTGFALRKPEADAFRYDDGGYLRNYDFVAIAYGVENGMLLLEQKKPFFLRRRAGTAPAQGRESQNPRGKNFGRAGEGSGGG